MIKAIVFDFGGVIVPGVILQFVKRFKTTDPRYILFKEASHKWDLGMMTVDEFYHVLSQITGMSKKSVIATFYDDAVLYTEVVDIVKALKQRYKIVLFSDNFAHNLYRYLDKFKLRDLFDVIVISSEHKVKKPDPQFFSIMLSLAQVKKDEAIFIDDTQMNVDGGEKLGITSFLYTTPEKLRSDLLAHQVIIS